MAEDPTPPGIAPLAIEPEPTLVPGSRLGKYQLVKRLSVGGMAEVFLARAVGLPGFQKLVAVKHILPQLACKPDFVQMFLDEARIAATLQHPYIVQTYDVGVVGREYFIAMEYLHGEDVRSILRAAHDAGRRIPLEIVLQIGIALCEALHYAHEKEGFDGEQLDIVHCDVSPGNLIVTYEGGIKLLDFGIASAAIRAKDTLTGVQGKLSYMSPEQARSEPLDRRTDIYAASVILYELSLGKKLYKGTSDYQILHNIVAGNFPTPRQIDPSYDVELERILLRALERNRDKRHQTANELQMELEALARQRGLFLSTTSLKKLMAELFGRKLDAWHEAQRQGKSLVDHLELVAAYDEDEEKPSATPSPPRRAWLWPAVAAAVVVILAAAGLAARHRGAAAPAAIAAPGARPSATAAATGANAAGANAVGTSAAETSAAETSAAGTSAAGVERPPSARPPAPGHQAPAGVGVTKVVTHPHGAHLLLDGRPLEGHSPITLDVAAEREHVVVAQLDGYHDATRRFIVGRDASATVTLFLNHGRDAQSKAAPAPAPAPVPEPVLSGEGMLALVSNPWCTVSIDGKARGQTPLNLKLPAGRHQVTLANPEFHVQRQLTVTVLPNQTVRKKLDFTE